MGDIGTEKKTYEVMPAELPVETPAERPAEAPAVPERELVPAGAPERGGGADG